MDLAVHHQSVWGGSFVNFLGLVNDKGDCRQDAQPIPSILELTKGALSNPVILTDIQTKLHPPYPNQTACLVYEFRSEKHLQCLKNMGLYNSSGGGRFSFWQSWLTQASKFANSQASTLNAGVPTAPYSPESNCSYLALI